MKVQIQFNIKKNTNKVDCFFLLQISVNQSNLCHLCANKNNLEKQDAFLTFFSKQTYQKFLPKNYLFDLSNCFYLLSELGLILRNRIILFLNHKMKLGFISDIHEDIESLQQAFKTLSQENCDSVLCLGDIVGFTLPFYRYISTRDANECVRLVKENCSLSVIGNHDLYAIKKIPEYKAGFDYDDNWYQLDYEIRSKKARNRIWLYEDNEIKTRLSEESKEFLSKLKEVDFFDTGKIKIMISHFCFPDFSGSAIFFPGEVFHLNQHFDFMKNNGAILSLSGHGHPDGAIYVDEDNFTLLKFGKFTFPENLYWLVIPCVARTTRPNGVLTLDTETRELKIISLKK